MFIYDIEIKHPIAPKNPAERDSSIEFYAKDFNDYANMGIACVGAYDYTCDKYRVFGEYELEDFQQFINSHDVAIGYNNIRFDNNVLRSCNIQISDSKSYDILAQIYSALGSFQKGCRLEDVIKANFPNSAGKSGDGAQAPILWQQGYHTKVIDYCLNDVRLTKMLLDRILRCGFITNPIETAKDLRIKRP